MWRVKPGQMLEYREWDDEFVLYNNLSGDTHLLGPAAIEILLLLREQSASATALAAALSGAEPDHDEAPLAHEVGTLLAELARLHLIEPA